MESFRAELNKRIKQRWQKTGFTGLNIPIAEAISSLNEWQVQVLNVNRYFERSSFVNRGVELQVSDNKIVKWLAKIFSELAYSGIYMYGDKCKPSLEDRPKANLNLHWGDTGNVNYNQITGNFQWPY